MYYFANKNNKRIRILIRFSPLLLQVLKYVQGSGCRASRPGGRAGGRAAVPTALSRAEALAEYTVQVLVLINSPY